MREQIEIRIPEESAKLLLPPTVGKKIGTGVEVRLLKLPVDDPLLSRLAEIDRTRVAAGRALITSWAIRRTYSRSEIEGAELFVASIHALAECAGEQFGTTYDEAKSCPFCGVGRIRTSPFRLGCSCLPKKDIATTLASDEILVSDSLTSLLRTRSKLGAELDQIEWIGECANLVAWSQLRVLAQVHVDRQTTRFGESPFEAANGARITACPLGHLAGLNLLSEPHVIRESYDGSDLAISDVNIGTRRGLLVPAPLILLGGPFGRLLLSSGLKGIDLQVAYLD
jgi:hypothetical protein